MRRTDVWSVKAKLERKPWGRDVIIRSAPPPECHLWFLSELWHSPYRKSSFLSIRTPPSLMKAYRNQLTRGTGMFCDLYSARNSIKAPQFNSLQPFPRCQQIQSVIKIFHWLFITGILFEVAGDGDRIYVRASTSIQGKERDE